MDNINIYNNIIKKIKEEVLKPNMDRLPLAYLITLKIPDSIKHFFDQEVENWIREEQDNVFSSERFDYEMPEVRMKLDQVFDILKNSANFSVIKFNQLLERAVKLEANYIISPHRTLTQFLFKDKPIISTIEVYDLLRYFSKFNYYKDALTEYFNLKYMKEISETQFEELVLQIDNQVFTKDPIQSILKIVKTIISFMNQGREETDSLSTKIVQDAFNDRNLTTHVKIVEVLIQRGFDSISIAQLEHILATGQLPEAEATQAEEDPKELLKQKLQSKLQLEKIKDIEKEKPAVEVNSISVPEKTEILEELYEEEEEVEEYEEEAVEEIEEEEEEVIQEVGEEKVEAETAEAQLANLVSQKLTDSQKGLPKLETIISTKLKKRYIKKLFKKSSKNYDKIIKLLNDTGSWKQASLIIDNKFYELGINPYSKEAIEFSDLVYNRYFAKDKEKNAEDFE